MKYFLIGYYGFGNDGDEWLKQSAIRLIKDEDPCAKISILSGPFPTHSNMDSYYSRHQIWRWVWAALRADYWVWGGGTVFQDFSSYRSFYYYFM